MIIVTTTQVRPSTEVEFYTGTQPLVSSALVALVSDSPHFSEPATFVMSEDGLIHQAVAKYPSEAALQAFLDELEQVVPGFFAARDAYSAEVGIIVNRTQEEV